MGKGDWPKGWRGVSVASILAEGQSPRKRGRNSRLEIAAVYATMPESAPHRDARAPIRSAGFRADPRSPSPAAHPGVPP